MIVALEGTLERRGNNSVIIKVGPLSLSISSPTSTLSQLGNAGDKVYLHTHLHVREDIIALYGFSSVEELGLFQSLITVSKIGPKTALGILSTVSPEQLIAAIEGDNIDLLSQVPGIGKKTAGRIVLELKGKLTKEWGGAIGPSLKQEDADVVAALTGLGYSLKEAMQAASTLSDSKGLVLEEKVRLALQRLART
jgi:Holliday junction DNA helicase RuvA